MFPTSHLVRQVDSQSQGPKSHRKCLRQQDLKGNEAVDIMISSNTRWEHYFLAHLSIGLEDLKELTKSMVYFFVQSPRKQSQDSESKCWFYLDLESSIYIYKHIYTISRCIAASLSPILHYQTPLWVLDQHTSLNPKCTPQEKHQRPCNSNFISMHTKKEHPNCLYNLWRFVCPGKPT